MCNCIDEGVGPISLQGLIESVQCCMCVGNRQLEVAKSSQGCQGLSMIGGCGYSSGADREGVSITKMAAKYLQSLKWQEVAMFC